MKIATFNCNSVRKRMPIILDWLKKERPDVLALQETKVQDVDFPVQAFQDAGYFVTYRGMKSYNGVAKSQFKASELSTLTFLRVTTSSPKNISTNLSGSEGFGNISMLS